MPLTFNIACIALGFIAMVIKELVVDIANLIWVLCIAAVSVLYFTVEKITNGGGQSHYIKTGGTIEMTFAKKLNRLERLKKVHRHLDKEIQKDYNDFKMSHRRRKTET